MWLLIAGVVGVLSWWISGLLVRKASFIRSIDYPNDRSLHAEPTPRSGGVAILASIVIGLAVATTWFAVMPSPMELLPKGLASASFWIVGSIAFVAAVSFLDDRAGLPVGVRLAVQTIAAIVVVWGGGLTLYSFPIPTIKTVELGWFAAPVSVVFLLWMTNLYNFMDGMDGFAGGMTTLGFGFLAYFGWRAGHPFMLLTTTVVAMSAFGFLFHNFPPARIFMGDVGSVPLGFTAGTLMLVGLRDGLFDIWVPILIFSPFILDATVTVLRRAWQRQRIWEAHRDHYYQRLVLSGWSHRQTVLAEYGVMVLCGGLAVLYQEVSEEWRLVILGLWGVLFASLAFVINGVEQRMQPVGP
ncbi:MAG TPA: glycosyltransferase family 4 protein [Nitrospiraceae bacterium]|nr:glycosyltransferase family 4 protein [Nitrospiraceae bacterium]